MKIITIFYVFLSINMLTVNVWGVSIENGEKLHNSNCKSCHQNDVYAHKNSMINSYSSLYKRIKQCEVGNKLAWSNEDIDDVSTYLNDSFYKFEKQ